MISGNVTAAPTKQFFISMLVRDISLVRSIADLVDNCIDGANRIDAPDLSRLFVRIELSADRFRISDNCGGIPIEIATEYAFRFGRPPEAEGLPHSVGQFGVGMKRALLKMGNHFTIESRTSTDHFIVEVDVPEWARAASWTFPIESESRALARGEVAGTEVIVDRLHEEVAAEFATANFAARLEAELRRTHERWIRENLQIFVNNHKLEAAGGSLLGSEVIRPHHQRFSINGAARVDVELFSGLGPADEKNAGGWYVYCNGRLVVGPERSSTTGWGDGPGLPAFHNQYALFRGYAFFDSQDASRVPWTTTKDGIDTSSRVYQRVRPYMRDAMRPVLAFLNDFAEERKRRPIGMPLTTAVLAALPTRIDQLTESAEFAAPAPPEAPGGPDTKRIPSYQRTADHVYALMPLLRTSLLRDVGPATFDFAYKMLVRKR